MNTNIRLTFCRVDHLFYARTEKGETLATGRTYDTLLENLKEKLWHDQKEQQDQKNL